VDVDSPSHAYRASLRVWSTTLTLARLTAVLGEPANGYDRGERISLRMPPERRRPRTLWTHIPEGGTTADLSDLVERLVAFMERRRAAFALLAPDIERDIFCGVFSGTTQGGWSFEPALIRRLAALDVPIVFDLY
jgi:hypothetical protein